MVAFSCPSYKKLHVKLKLLKTVLTFIFKANVQNTLRKNCIQLYVILVILYEKSCCKPVLPTQRNVDSSEQDSMLERSTKYRIRKEILSTHFCESVWAFVLAIPRFLCNFLRADDLCNSCCSSLGIHELEFMYHVPT